MFPGDAGERLKRDFDRTLNDLLIDNHVRPIRRWADRKGLHARGQAYQAGAGELGLTENNRLAAALQKPDVETLGFGDPNIGALSAVEPGSADARTVLDRYRQVVSGAHLSGAREITNEWGAVLNGQFRVRLEDLRAFADRSLAAGVSRMMLHAFSYRTYAEPPGSPRRTPPWPGWCAYCGGPLEFSDSWNQRWPMLKALPALAGYVGRAGAAIRSGRPRVDLTLLAATSRVAGIGVTPPAPGSPEDRLREVLQGAGYTWDAMDPISLPSAGDVSRGRLLANGPAYKAVVVNDLESIPGATAARLAGIAREGLPIVVYGRVPAKGAGFKDASSEDSAVRAAVRRLRGLRNVRFATTPSALVGALRALAGLPDLAEGGAGTVVPVHRRTATGDVWFLYNDSKRRVSRTLSFATAGAPTQIDLWTGRATRLAHYTRRAGRVAVPVTLDPAGTAVLTFDRRRPGGPSVTATTANAALAQGSRLVLRDLRGGRQAAVLPDGRLVGATLPTLPGPRTVIGPWRLIATTVAPEGDARVELTAPPAEAGGDGALADWRDIPGLASKSGTGTYTATVDVPAAWLRAGRGVLLDPGDFGGALRVWVNGRFSLGAPVPGEEPRDVTRLLRAGRNTLRLEVSTTLDNAMRAHAQLGDPNYASYVGRPVQDAGLTGPVRLVPYAQAAVVVARGEPSTGRLAG